MPEKTLRMMAAQEGKVAMRADQVVRYGRISSKNEGEGMEFESGTTALAAGIRACLGPSRNWASAR